MVSRLWKGLWTTGFVRKGLTVHPSFWDELGVVVDRLIVFPRGGSWSGESKKLFEWSKCKHIILNSYYNLRLSSIIAIVCKAWYHVETHFCCALLNPSKNTAFLEVRKDRFTLNITSWRRLKSWIPELNLVVTYEHDLFWTWTITKREHGANRIVSRVKAEKYLPLWRKEKETANSFHEGLYVLETSGAHAHQISQKQTNIMKTPKGRSLKFNMVPNFLDFEAPFQPVIFSVQATFLGCRFPFKVSEFQPPWTLLL